MEMLLLYYFMCLYNGELHPILGTVSPLRFTSGITVVGIIGPRGLWK